MFYFIDIDIDEYGDFGLFNFTPFILLMSFTDLKRHNYCKFHRMMILCIILWYLIGFKYESFPSILVFNITALILFAFILIGFTISSYKLLSQFAKHLRKIKLLKYARTR